MSRTVFKLFAALASGAVLGGCGLVQTATDATTTTFESVFYKPVKTLHLDFSGRAAMNTHPSETMALSVPTLVRVYQLRDQRAVERADYDRLVSNDESILAGSLLDTHAVVVRPEQGAQLNVPLDKDAQYVVIVAMFRQPDTQAGAWRLTLNRDDLDPEKARVIELQDNTLSLRPLAEG
jgi:type VI secretion system protein VasD